jgi:L-galactose dehydrogenase
VELRQLGRTGLNVSEVSYGTAPLGELFGPLDEGAALRMIDHVIDSGINLIDTSPYYGSAEERLGKALTPAKRDKIVLGTKAGRYGLADFDFSPSRIRASLENSLRLLRTDHVDLFQLHDIEFVDLGPVFDESYAELQRLKDEGKCGFIGMTGYPLKTFSRVLRETDVDVLLTYAHGTLLDGSISHELLPLARSRGVGLMNAAAVALGLLTPRWTAVDGSHPAPREVQEAALKMVRFAQENGTDISFLANQYAIQRSGAATTVVGTRTSHHLQSAIDAAGTPIDEALLDELLALRPQGSGQWTIGLKENN